VPHRSHVISLMLVAERDTDDVNCHVDVGLLSGHPSPPPPWPPRDTHLGGPRVQGRCVRPADLPPGRRSDGALCRTGGRGGAVPGAPDRSRRHPIRIVVLLWRNSPKNARAVW